MNKHAIIVIKNNSNEYLQYFDNRWNSFLFPNCKLDENFNDNTIIKDYISKILNINRNELECTYIGDKVHTKFSEGDQKLKEYHHFIFNVELSNIPQILKEKSFNINALEYTWYSYDELKNDERIQKVNNDIVGFINEFGL